MMKQHQIDEFRQQLQEQQKVLQELKDTGDEASKTVVLDQTSVGRLSRMDALQAQAMSEERVRRRQIELQDIAAALQRIDSGDYGYCADCGEEISMERLQFSPSALLCIECAEKADKH